MIKIHPAHRSPRAPGSRPCLFVWRTDVEAEESATSIGNYVVLQGDAAYVARVFAGVFGGS